MAQDTSIKQAFHEGMQELFGIMFTSVDLLMLDETSTVVNDIYGEVKSGAKKYKPPLTLKAKVDLALHEVADDTEGKYYNATFRFPTKEFLDNDIDLSSEGLDVLRKARIEFKGVQYEVEDIKPQTNIQGDFLFYQFVCNEV